jgi:hypothetical protein
MKKEEQKDLVNEILNRCRVDKEKKFKLTEHRTDWTGSGDFIKLGDDKLKKKAKKILDDNLEEYRPEIG